MRQPLLRRLRWTARSSRMQPLLSCPTTSPTSPETIPGMPLAPTVAVASVEMNSMALAAILHDSTTPEGPSEQPHLSKRSP